MASLSSSIKLGSTSPTSLLKSAGALSRELATYNDTVQKVEFANNPSDSQLNTYLTYLTDRVKTLSSSSSITDQTKAITLGQEMHSAISTNTSFNIQNESIQVLTGNATDQQKLDYINSAFERANAIGDYKLAQSLESQAYNFQQSMQMHAQQAQTAAITNFNSDQAAIKGGYQNTIDAIDTAWKAIDAAYKDGQAGEVQAAIDSFMKTQGPALQALGVQLPAGAQPTMGSLAQAVMTAKLMYYENGATALNAEPNPTGGVNQDAKAFQAKADAIYQGVDKLPGPTGDMNLQEITKWAMETSNMYSPATSSTGQTTYQQNAVTGYKVIKGQLVPGYAPSTQDIAVPQTTGQVTTPYDALPKDQKTAIIDQLKKLGFGPASTSSSESGGWTKNGELTVTIGDNAASWLTNNGKANADLAAGSKVTLIPTNGGKGFQFVSASGNAYGLSSDYKGLMGLYSQTDTGGWNKVGGQYGYTGQAAAPSPMAQPQNRFANIARSGFVPTPQTSRSPLPTQVARPAMTQRVGGGYNFVNAQGQPISAATYSMLTGTPFRTLLSNMATTGDTGAQTALQFVGNDYGYDPTKAISYQNQNVYNALVWGAKGVNQMSTPGMTTPGARPTTPTSAPGIPGVPSGIPGVSGRG